MLDLGKVDEIVTNVASSTLKKAGIEQRKTFATLLVRPPR